MNMLFWLDMPLMLLGLFAMSPGLWYAIRARRSIRRPTLGACARTMVVLVSFLGLGVFTAASIDAGLAEWEQASRAKGTLKPIHESMMAPDFSLPSLDDGHNVRLSDFRGHKPVVLIFGNFY